MFNPKIVTQLLKKPAQRLAMNFVMSKINQWKKQNPQAYNEAVALISGKTDDEQKQIAEQLSAELGIDFKKIADAFGYKM